MVDEFKQNSSALSEPASVIDYDKLPYRSVPYSQTQPSHLAAIAHLFNLNSPSPETARVLELGCASGGNIIPLASRCPSASFLGLDLSERQVADGNDRIKALGLGNVEVRQADIATVDLSNEQFDYIICHGVYSWIPDEAQDAVFKIAAQTLVDTGILYVSYNTYPGWHMRTVVRDICLYHAGTDGTPETRVQRARWALDKLANLSNEASPYGQLLRNEAKLNARLPDSYILGEFLATHNTPCFFHEFIERAGKHGLQFFSETDLASSIPETLDAETAKLVRSIAGSSGSALEQYMDFFVGRQFRRSLLIKSSDAPKVSRAIGAERLNGLHLSCSLQLDAEASSEDEAVFKNAAIKVPVKDPVLKKMFEYLEAVFPETRTPDEIIDHLLADQKGDQAAAREAVLKVLFNMAAGSRLEMYATALKCGRGDDETPKVWAVAQAEATTDQTWISTQRHSPVGLDPALKPLMALLDGTRTREELRIHLSEALQAGQITVKGVDVGPQTSAELLADISHQVLNKFMIYLERSALLERSGPKE